MVSKTPRRSARKARPAARGDENVGLDDIDKFHERRSARLSKGAAKLRGEDNLSEESDNDQEVFAMDDSDDSSSSSDSNDSNTSSAASVSSGAADDSDDASSSDSSSEEAAPEDPTGTEGWGSKRSMHYGADEDEASDDSEMERAELAEAKRIQQKQLMDLREDDFALPGDSDDSDAESDDGKKGKKKKKEAKKKGKKGKSDTDTTTGFSLDDIDVRGGDGSSDGESDDGVVRVERVSKKLSVKDQIRMVQRDTPELEGLLAELTSKLTEVKDQIAPVLDKAKTANGISTEKGISYLEVKSHLLLNYCMNVTFYLLMKVNGQSPRDHPVVEHLVELRTVMEKLRPLDNKLKFQIDKLLALAASGVEAQVRGGGAGESMTGRANLDSMMDSDDESGDGSGDDKTGVYRPPKMMSVQYDETETGKKERREARRALEKKKKSSVLRELREEFSEAPREESTGGFGDLHARDDEKDEERQDYEEEMFVRLQLSKKDKKKREKRNEQRVNFFEDFNDFEDMAEATANKSGRDKDKTTTVMQQVAQAAAKEKQRRKQAMRSGDSDLPLGEDRVRDRERRVLAQSMNNPFDDDNFGGMGDGAGKNKRTEAELAAAEDELYRDVATDSRKRKAAKASRAEAEQYYVQADEGPDGEKREVGYQISQNRGLTRYRKKEDKNPRAKKRRRFEKATIKRKGQVRSHDTKSARQAYGGEATGIRANLTRSTKF